MARPNPTPKPALALGASAEQAAAALAAGKFREAADLYKDLLKREPRVEWKLGLAQAYSGRAVQMAAKGMLQEAIALWRTRAQACGVPLLEGPYLDWLARTGSLQTVLPALLAAAHEGPPEEQAARQSRLAGAVLAAEPSALAQVPPGSPLLQHRVAARAALAALAAGDSAALDAALQGIPFRSPYRDLRPLLKAALLIRSDAPAAVQMMARVAADGPFEMLAAALRVAAQPTPHWLAAWAGLDPAARDLVLAFKGCPPDQRALVAALVLPPGPADANEALFKALTQHRKHLPHRLARRWARRLMLHQATPRRAEFTAAFGPLSDDQKLQEEALRAQIKQDSQEAEFQWEELAEMLEDTSSQPHMAAHILRHLARQRPTAGVPGPDVTDWLQRSLVLEPEHRGAHLALIQALRQQGQARPAREQIETSLARWPDDTALLQQALELALESGAFKKAATLATQILRLDPLNPRVPDLIGQAHLSHARKLIKADKPAGAMRELEQAAAVLRTHPGLGRLNLLRALIAPHEELGHRLRAALADLTDLGGVLVGAFQLALEGHRVHGDALAPLTSAGVDVALHKPSAAEVLALAQALNGERARDRAVVAAIEVLGYSLEQAARTLHLSEDGIVQVCEALHRHRLDDTTRCFARAGRQQWPANTVLLYLDMAVAHSGRPWAMPDQDMRALDRAFHAAQQQGDGRMAKRIADLLNGVPDRKAPRRARRRMPMFGPLFAPDDDDDDDLANFNPDGIDPAQLLEMFNAALGPGERDDFRARTKGMSPGDIRGLLMDFLEQARLEAQMGSPPRRKGRK